jgi:hypothetical protein
VLSQVRVLPGPPIFSMAFGKCRCIGLPLFARWARIGHALSASEFQKTGAIALSSCRIALTVPPDTPVRRTTSLWGIPRGSETEPPGASSRWLPVDCASAGCRGRWRPDRSRLVDVDALQVLADLCHHALDIGDGLSKEIGLVARPGADRHERECARSFDAGPAFRFRLLPSGCEHRRRRVWRTGVLYRGC